MPLKKNDPATRAIAAKGVKARRAKAQAWDNIVGWLVGDGGHKFKDLIADLANGKEIKKEQKEFLDHFKDLLEYHQPKLSRTEQNTTHEGEINQNITVKFE